MQVHRIQQREIDEKMGKKPTLMQELTGEKDGNKGLIIETISSVDNTDKEPEYRLYKKKTGPNYLFGEFKFPDVVSFIHFYKITLKALRKNYRLMLVI